MTRFQAAFFAVAAIVLAPGEGQAVTFQNIDMYRSQLAAPIYTGVGRLGFDVGGGFAPSCTASLVGRNVILTAAHCLTDSPAARFLLSPTSAVGSHALSFTLRNALALSSASGSGMSDMALITLDRNVYGRDIYDLYTDRDELGQVVTMVGAGYSGLLAEGGSPALTDTELRYGLNRYDASAADIGYGDDVYMVDNDNGFAENDVFGRYLGVRDTGVRVGGQVVDAGLIYGDSGGPDFIGKRLAGVHSFAGTGSFFERPDGEGCGLPGSVDPVAKGVLGSCTDGSFGDFSGSVRVSSYQQSIRDYISATAVPEPATWALMVAGFGAVGATLRRRRRGVVAA